MVQAWDPLEPYDPMRPNDYNEYKIWHTKDRIERRERLAEQRRYEERHGKRSRRSGSYYSDSEGTDEGEDERPRKTGSLAFLFCLAVSTKTYAGRYETYDHWSREDDLRSSEAPMASVAVDVDMTGDEAYQRRLAMSKGLEPPPSEHKQSPSPSPEGPPTVQSGEEAYLRRLAMSALNATRAGLTAQAVAPPDHKTRSPSPPDLHFNPFEPPSVPQPPPPGNVIVNFQEKAQAAAAIAARLAALAPAGGAISGDGPSASAPLVKDETQR